jgi:hypothetical protein
MSNSLEAKAIRAALLKSFTQQSSNGDNLISALASRGITEVSQWLLTITEVEKWREFTSTKDVLYLAQSEKILKCLGYTQDEARDRAISNYLKRR